MILFLWVFILLFFIYCLMRMGILAVRLAFNIIVLLVVVCGAILFRVAWR